MHDIFDSHAHYTMEAFEPDRDELLSALPSKGVAGVMLAAVDAEDSAACVSLAGKYDYIYASVGIHPENASGACDERLEQIASAAADKKVRAIGEIGLDYHYDNTGRALQLELFEKQLALASELKLPVIVHSRDACRDTLELLKKYRPSGVLHCFSGSAETVAEVTALGMHIGFTGVLTFKNAKKALLALKAVPTDRLLLETDCPYMAPEPFRGRRCDSSMLGNTARAAAEVKGLDVQELLSVTCENAMRLYGIEK